MKFSLARPDSQATDWKGTPTDLTGQAQSQSSAGGIGSPASAVDQKATFKLTFDALFQHIYGRLLS